MHYGILLNLHMMRKKTSLLQEPLQFTIRHMKRQLKAQTITFLKQKQGEESDEQMKGKCQK